MNETYTQAKVKKSINKVEMKLVEHANEKYYKILNYNYMRPFFMSIVSDANHWMFISSNGGISAGRKNPEFALFPYYTDDKINESADITGSKTIFHVHKNGESIVWAPFSERFTDKFTISRNLYKSIYGNKIIFEEINHDLALLFRYQWNSSKIYGFVRKVELINQSSNQYTISLLDGLQNIMPYGVPSDLQRSGSNLVDAYKRSELDNSSGIGIYALSAIIVDKAEPSEALKANIAWSLGLDNPKFLLSSLQLNNFRQKKEIQQENDVKGEKGAYFISNEIILAPHDSKRWEIIANVNQNQSQIISLRHALKDPELLKDKIQTDIESGSRSLITLVGGADGFQCSSDQLNDSRHFSNVLFNIMRGGTFDNNYTIKKSDFMDYLNNANRLLISETKTFINQFPDRFSSDFLKEKLLKNGNADLIRLGMEYLPIKFSRRHGDPSRPWNNFSINTQDENDGSDILDYEGNWRDIFQNWEALAYSYPGFLSSIIFKFLNTSTFDGYNPYRITKGGFDWETIEPDNPWSYIGYWGDHQIIYLLKLLEAVEKFYPGTLESYFDKDWFVYAAVPYIIKPYEQILENSKDTIEFDHAWDENIRRNREELGADGAILTSTDKEIYRVNFIEKILASVLAKMSNLIVGGGIWMNTQRPEWNDANNALVGNGVSMVTLYYLRRFMRFFQKLFESSEHEHVKISSELIEFYHSVRETLEETEFKLKGELSNREKRRLLDRLAFAASEYRKQIYRSGFWGKKRSASLSGLRKFTKLSLSFLEHSIESNKRNDDLYHAYNLVQVKDSELSVSHLSEMLEGQVAVLSSGYLSSKESLQLLDALKQSALFRDDQYSYILYPNKDLPGFLDKNTIPPEDAQSCELIEKLLAKGNRTVVEKDIEGKIHFNGNLKNAKDLKSALQQLAENTDWHNLVKRDEQQLLDIFEKVFNHLAFTGRSGTFFGYEGLGSIYWHMVSKLHLAVQECCLKAIEKGANESVVGRLLEHYYEIEAGIGVHKSPQLYGAFPTDPYSHTPMHRGAQQPGMTGQVKEDILVRFGELGVFVANGQLVFKPELLRKEEFLDEEATFKQIDLDGRVKQFELGKKQLAFTFCNVAVIYKYSQEELIKVFYKDGKVIEQLGNQLDHKTSSSVFERKGEIDHLEVSVKVIR